VRAVLALVAGFLVAVAAAQAAREPPERGRCRPLLLYNGIKYNGIEAAHLRLRRGPSAGTALQPVCRDTPPFPPRPQYRRVAAWKLVGIRPRVAIALRTAPNLIYVAIDRCRGVRSGLLRCLRNSR
jgi:Family of unknown function (DUF6281)